MFLQSTGGRIAAGGGWAFCRWAIRGGLNAAPHRTAPCWIGTLDAADAAACWPSPGADGIALCCDDEVVVTGVLDWPATRRTQTQHGRADSSRLRISCISRQRCSVASRRFITSASQCRRAVSVGFAAVVRSEGSTGGRC